MTDCEVDSALAPLLQAAREDSLGDVPASIDVDSRTRLLARLRAAPASASRPRFRLARWATAMAMMSAVVVALMIWLTPARPLSFAVNGESATTNGSVTIQAGRAPQSIAFTDGTRVSFAEGASGRVADVSAHGARIVVANGRVHFDVVHLPGAVWSVEAGSYVIHVTGTEFDVEWSEASGALHVGMIRGSVMVEDTNRAVRLVAGQSLDLVRTPAAAPSAAFTATAATATAAAETPPSASATVSADSELPPSTSKSRDESATHRERWSVRVSRGDYAGVVGEAVAFGTTSVLASAPLDDLDALAEAARYQGKQDLGRQALEAERSRFASSNAAHTATFLLGRMADDGGSPNEAIALYDEYLASGGPFAAEALGRKMLAVNRISGPKAAEPIARQYVDAYPDGGYARTAHIILGDP